MLSQYRDPRLILGGLFQGIAEVLPSAKSSMLRPLLTGRVPPEALVNKGHDNLFRTNELADKCTLRLLGVFLGDEAEGHRLVGDAKLKELGGGNWWAGPLMWAPDRAASLGYGDDATTVCFHFPRMR